MDVFHETGGPPVISVTQVRTGVYSMYCLIGDFADAVLGSGAASELFVRTGLYYTGGLDARDRTFCTLFGASGALLSFQIRAADNVILVRLGNHTSGLLASGGVVPLNSWSCIEIHALIDNAVGIVQVRLDGVQVIDFFGDTQVGANTVIYAVRWAAPRTSVPPGRYVCYGYYDDLAINSIHGPRNNSWLGLGGIIGLVPTGVGNYTQLTPSAGANWAAVNEIPPTDDAAYVESAVIDQKDTYTMQDLIITPGQVADIAAVQWLCRAYNTVAQGGDFARLLRLYGVDHQGDDVGYDRSYDYHPEVLETSPDTGQEWTEDKINALEAGVVVR